MKRMHELEQEAPVCAGDRRSNEIPVGQETGVQEEGLAIVTEAVQETVQEMAPEGLVEGRLDDDLLVKGFQ